MSEKLSKIGNNHRRYRLNDFIAKKLGCEINAGKRYRLTDLQELQLLSFQQKPIKRLFFDLETSPNVLYSWRIGWNITLAPHDIIEERRIICVSYKWEDEDKVHTITWDKDKDDKSLLEKFMPILHSADEIVAHNSKRFDEKWLRTRCIYHRVPTFPKYKSLDTLSKARSGFNFNSNKLDYIAKFLGVGAKVNHEGFSMWKKIMELPINHPDYISAMANMVEYCEGDIVVLEDVFHAMESYMSPETHAGVTNGNCKYSCPSCGSEVVHLYKNRVTAAGTVQRVMECEACSQWYNISNSAYKLYREINWGKQH